MHSGEVSIDVALPFPVESVPDEWLEIVAAARERVATSTEQVIDYRLHAANQIGVVEPTVRHKARRVLQPRGDRNRSLPVRAGLLLERLESVGAEPSATERARRQVDIERFRADLLANRVRRIIPVVRRAASGDHQKYCGQGAMDIVRDVP